VKASRFLKVVLVLDGALVAVVLAVCAAFLPADVTLGVAVGGALGAANLAALGWLGGRLVTGEGAKWPWALALAGKFALLIGVVAVAVLYVPMDVVGFVTGLTAAGVAMVAATAWLAVRNVELTP
jgi:hypothetical protein